MIKLAWIATRAFAKKVPVMGSETIMSAKVYGTCVAMPQKNLRFNCDLHTAGRIGCFNRHYAEHSGYAFQGKITFVDDLIQFRKNSSEPFIFYDSISGKPLFQAPVDRNLEDFLNESEKHGWPSFRDSEVYWENVRVLEDGETVSIDGTHLGHNLPDHKGNRYCINLVAIAGNVL